jgi:hypothetical protein
MKDLTDNEVLADFIGKRLEKPSTGFYQQWEFPREMCDGYYPSVPHLEFDKRWERLMPVWYKFRDLSFPEICSERVDTLREWKQDIGEAILKGPTPSEACKLLANAIRWYQSVKK